MGPIMGDCGRPEAGDIKNPGPLECEKVEMKHLEVVESE
jgi:hypothetical protein